MVMLNALSPIKGCILKGIVSWMSQPRYSLQFEVSCRLTSVGIIQLIACGLGEPSGRACTQPAIEGTFMSATLTPQQGEI